MFRIALKSLVFAALAPAAAWALLIRADRADDEYAELATRYPAGVLLAPGQGEGVLVAPRWILTSAHRGAVLRDLSPRPALSIGGASYAIAAVVVHPDWKGGRDNDIALLELAQPVTGVAPAAIHRAADEKGQGIVLVAHGSGGKLGALANGPRRRRAAINTVDDVQGDFFVVTIKSGDEASDLQGAALREETGAPAFIDTPLGFTVGGILAAVEEPRSDAPSGSAGEREIFTRLSAYAGWIDSTTGVRPLSTSVTPR